VYLSPMIDCFDGLVVSWSIGTRPDADLVNTMLDGIVNLLSFAAIVDNLKRELDDQAPTNILQRLPISA